MADQGELECVSCDTTFDPAPNGGFCPDCDTPHPDFEMDEDGASADESPDAGSDADAQADDSQQEPDSVGEHSMAYCPECGADLDSVGSAGGDVSGDLDACPDCGHAVTDESYCPNCGTDLDAVRDDAGSEDESAPDAVTLVIDGESYTFGDGDTFGRQDGEWLDALIAASGGSDDVAFISSEHLQFSVDDDGFYVTDISTNGTKLNGTELDGDEAKLEDGDTLELAERAEITVEL